MSYLLHQMSAEFPNSHCRLKTKYISILNEVFWSVYDIILYSSSQDSFQMADCKHSKKHWFLYLVVNDAHHTSVKVEVLLHFSNYIIKSIGEI